jgi:predicted GNAT family acetyltransferase
MLMTQDYDVRREDGSERGRYVITLDPNFEAEMTYRKTSDGVVSVDHTGVPKHYEGRGIAAALVKHSIADARANGFKIYPICPYVVVQFQRHPEWTDVLADQP